MVELGLVPRKTVSKPGSHPRPPAFKSFGRTSLKYEGFQVSWQPIYGYLGVGMKIKFKKLQAFHIHFCCC